MFIGIELKNRMNTFGMTVEMLADKSLVSQQTINDIASDKMKYDEIDTFDMALISSALHCEPEYFIDAGIRKKDIVNAAENRENDTEKSINAKAKVQDYLNDLAFVNGLQ